MPWDTLFPKQREVFDFGIGDYAKKRHPNSPAICLVEGPRATGKTIGVADRVIRHLWETPQARFAMIAKTQPSALDAGAWVDLTEIAIPRWIDAGVSSDRGTFRYTTMDREGVEGPKSAMKTRTMFFRIENYFGGESEMILMSVQHDHEIKQKLKNTRFSGIWISELSNFQDRNILKVSWEQLRMMHLEPWQHLWISDTNPSEEGEESWIYRKFISRVDDRLDDGSLPDTEYNRSIHHIHFDLKDNLSLTKEKIALREAHYRDDPGEKARDFEGRWVKGHGNRGKHFADIFSRSIHVIGDMDGGDDSIELAKSTDKLITGWDLGSSVNHAAGIIEKRMVLSPDRKREWSVFSIIESYAYIHEQMGLSELTAAMLRMMDDLETDYAKQFGWTHWSDDSAITTWRPSSESFDYQEILLHSNNRIMLSGVPKPNNSQHARVRLVRRLLRERRLFVAAKCAEVIEMFEELSQGASIKEFIKWNRFKHIFDWISYVLFMENAEDLEVATSRPESTGRGDLSVNL